MKANEIIQDRLDEGLPSVLSALPGIATAAQKGVSWAAKLLKKSPKGIAPVTRKAKDYKEMREMLKNLGLKSDKAKAIARAKVQAYPAKTLEFLKWGVTLDYVNDYFVEIAELENQLERVRAGDKTTEIFGDATVEEAEKAAKEYRNKRLAELVAVGMVSFGVASKAFNGIGYLTKSLVTVAGGGASGARLAGGFAASPAKLAALLSKLIEGGPIRNIALITFLQSDMGKKFLENVYIDTFLQTAGALLSTTINLGIQALEAAGITVPDAVKSKINPPEPAVGSAAPSSTKTSPSDSTKDYGPGIDPSKVLRQLKVTRDPKNPKIIYINNMKITDADGYQDVGNSMIDDIKRIATYAKMPKHVVFSIPKDPKKIYDPYGSKPKN